MDLVGEGRLPLKVGDLAERAGISRPTFYKYFPILGDAVLHTAQTLLHELEAYIEPRVPKDANSRERLLARVSLSFEFSRAHPEVTRFFSFYDFTFRGPGMTQDEEARRGAIAKRAGDPFYELFRAGQADGSIDSSLPPDVTYLALITSMTGTSQRLLVERAWTTGSDRRARGVHDTLIDLWRQRLTPKGPS